MSFSINTNSGAMAALRTLTATQTSLSKTQSRIESGFKVGSAKDDPSTFVIAQGMRGDIGGLKAVKEGLNFGKASINMASAAANSISGVLNKLQEKATQAGNQSLDPATLQAEAKEMVNQIKSIVDSATLGGINLLDVSQSSTTGMKVLSGVTPGGGTSSITVAQQDATTATLGLDDLSLSPDTYRVEVDDNLDIQSTDTVVLVTNDSVHASGNNRTVTFEFLEAGDSLASTADEANNEFVVGVEIDNGWSALQKLDALKAKAAEYGISVESEGKYINFNHGNGMTTTGGAPDAAMEVTFTGAVVAESVVAGDALGVIDNAKTLVGNIMSALGATANRLDAQQEFTQVLIDTFNEGVGILVDANLAEESAKLQALQTKEQLGIQSLSIANQRPQSIMSLFR